MGIFFSLLPDKDGYVRIEHKHEPMTEASLFYMKAIIDDKGKVVKYIRVPVFGDDNDSTSI